MSTGQNTQRLIERLDALVSIETPTGDSDGIARAHELLREWFEPFLGPARVEHVDGVDHLLWRGGERPRVLLLGHVDTVWSRGTVARRPFAVDGQRITGPGVFDMKAGLLILAEAVARAGRSSDIAVLVTSDEEIGSITSRGLVEREASRSGAVIVAEPSLAGALKVARRGGGIYRLSAHGRAAHAGLEPESGHNALVEVARHVLALPAAADPVLDTTVSPTVARAGTVTNVIPELAELDIDVRAWTLAELERVDAHLLGVRPHDENVRVSVTGGINRPPMEPANSQALLEIARQVAAARGLGPIESAAVGGASDGNFTAALGVPTIDGLGPNGGGAHAEDEWVELDSIVQRIELVAGMIDALPEAG